jgi:microcystin-dependent protein
MPYAGNPGAAAGTGTIWVDANGNPQLTRADGSVQFLGVPPGTVAFTAGQNPDAGWAFCDGSWVSKAANPQLNVRIGNIYGGDANNLALPDIRARVIAGRDDGQTGRLTNTIGAASLGATGGLDYHYLTAAQIPAHTHGYSGSNTVTSGVANQSLAHSHTYTEAYDNFVGVRWFDSHNEKAIRTSNTGVTEPPAHNHNVTYSWSGNTDGGAGLASSWHPNVQPTIVLTAQIKLG